MILEIDEGSSLKSYFNEFDSIVIDLSNLNVSLDDADLSINFLCSLRKDFMRFRETVLYGKDVITLEEERALCCKGS